MAKKNEPLDAELMLHDERLNEWLEDCRKKKIPVVIHVSEPALENMTKDLRENTFHAIGTNVTKSLLISACAAMKQNLMIGEDIDMYMIDALIATQIFNTKVKED